MYRPIPEEDPKRAGNLQALGDEAEKAEPGCEAEIAAAQRLFGNFADEKVTLALLPPQARELLGSIDGWRWCLLPIRCCIIFGWLVCRRPRGFRSSAYYLYRYWLCVRQPLGTPVTPGKFSDAERKDLDTLIGALAKACRPYLTDQLATVDFTAGLPQAIDAGELDCHEGEEEAAAVFERLLTADAGYQDVHRRDEAKGPMWHVAMRRGKRKKLNTLLEHDFLIEQIEPAKASVRAKVEHPFRMIKCKFGFAKVRYRGLAKNTAQLVMLFAQSNCGRCGAS